MVSDPGYFTIGAAILRMTDFHTHILPGIDDGSKDIGMTERMLEAEMAQGVSHVFATPHFYANRRSVESFLARRNTAVQKLNELHIERPELPRVTVGAEVYYFAGIGKADSLPELCVEGTDLLLLELPFRQWHSGIIDDIREILDKRKLQIILAHVERYEQFQKDKGVWNEVIDMPLTLQLNCGSFIDRGSFFRKNHEHGIAFDILQSHSNCIIGSDCHNLTDRSPNIAKGREAIRDKAGIERLSELDDYTDKLFTIL